MAVHSKVKAGAWTGAGGVALGPLLVYLADWWGMPPMGEAPATAAGAALVWLMNNAGAWLKRETVHRPFDVAPSDRDANGYPKP